MLSRVNRGHLNLTMATKAPQEMSDDTVAQKWEELRRREAKSKTVFLVFFR